MGSTYSTGVQPELADLLGLFVSVCSVHIHRESNGVWMELSVLPLPSNISGVSEPGGADLSFIPASNSGAFGIKALCRGLHLNFI